MKKERKPKSFIYKPYYEGGMDALKKFVSTQLKYPAKAAAAQIKGVVKLKYDIDYKGKVVGVKILKGLGYGCDEEAIRIVKLLKFKVRKIRKVKVLYHKTINIHFRPNARVAKKVLQPNFEIKYTVNPSKQDSADNKTTGYSYNIEL